MSSIYGAVHGPCRVLTLAWLAALPSLDARAQTNGPAVPAKVAGQPVKSTAKAAPAASKDLQAVTVVARGSTRQIQSIGAPTIRQSVPGTSPLKLLNTLPGVNFQSSDPFGAYEWSTQINLHGFDQSRLGFTLDGIPLGNMSYHPESGLQETRAISPENLASTQIAQGAGALGTAANTNLGGTIQFYSADPDLKPGVRINQMIGSDSTKRSFVRADTGDHDGFSAYASYVHYATDKWKGYGSQKSRQINTKALYQWGDGNRISAFADIVQHKEYDTDDLSLASKKAFGWKFDYLQPHWDKALQMANAYKNSGKATSGVANGYPAFLAALPADYDWLDSTYYAGGGLRQDHLYALSGVFNLAEDLSLNLTTYYHNNRGEGQYTTPYQSSPASGLPLSMRASDYRLRRYGASGSLQYTIAQNDLELGFWVENATHQAERNYFNLYGQYTSLFNFYNAEKPFMRGFSQLYNFDTRMGYAQDTLHFLDDRLTVSFGDKFLHVTSHSKSKMPTDDFADGRLNATKGLLPQAGADYRIDRHQDVYVSYSKNMAAYGSMPFGQSQAAFDASKGGLQPETSQTYETGYRFQTRKFEASADLYYTRFANRLLSVTPCPAAITCANDINNVGSVKSRGVDLTAVWKPLHGLRWMNTASFNRSHYEDNYKDGGAEVADAGGIVHVRGAQTVDTPKWMYSSQADYQIAHWDFELDGKYTGKRYITYTDDASVPAYWLFNMSIQYDLGRLLPDVEDVGLGFNIYNLGDKRYFSSVGTNGFTAGGQSGRYNQTLQVGAPRQFFFNVNVKL